MFPRFCYITREWQDFDAERMRAKGVIVLGGRPTRTSYDPEDTPFWNRTRAEQLELTDAQILELMNRLPGVELLVEHGRSKEWGASAVGTIVRAFHNEQGHSCVEFELFDTPEAHRAAAAVRNGTLKDLSLAHNAITGQPIEVSLCRQGARPGTHITDVLGSADAVPDESTLVSYKETHASHSQCCVVWASNAVHWTVSDMDTSPIDAPHELPRDGDPVCTQDMPTDTSAAGTAGNTLLPTQVSPQVPVVNGAASSFEQLGTNVRANQAAKAAIRHSSAPMDMQDEPPPQTRTETVHAEPSDGNWFKAITQNKPLDPKQLEQLERFLERNKARLTSTRPQSNQPTPSQPPQSAPGAATASARPVYGSTAAAHKQLAVTTANILSTAGIDPLTLGVSPELWAQEADANGGNPGPRAMNALAVALQLRGMRTATPGASSPTTKGPSGQQTETGAPSSSTGAHTDYIMRQTQNMMNPSDQRQRPSSHDDDRGRSSMDTSTEEPRVAQVEASADVVPAVTYLPESMYRHIFSSRPTEEDCMALQAYAPPTPSGTVMASSGYGWERVTTSPFIAQEQMRMYNALVRIWKEFETNPDLAARCEAAAESNISRYASALARHIPPGRMGDQPFQWADPVSRSQSYIHGTVRGPGAGAYY